MLLAVLLMAPLQIGSAAASTFRVDGVAGADGAGCGSEMTPCATIQHAVDLANPGDTILVAEAVYTDDVDCLGEQAVVCVFQKELSILGGFSAGAWTIPDPVNNTTVIDGQGTRRGVIARRGGSSPTLPTTSLQMEGFTVRNGRAVGNPHGFGGGLKASFADIILRDMVFEDNIAVGGSGGFAGGGGVAIQADVNNLMSVVLERNLFRDNQVTGGGGTGGAALGGGLLVDYSSVTGLALDFQGNTVIGGASASAGRDGLGGAVALSFGVTATLQDLTASSNSAIGGSASTTGGSAFGGAAFTEGGASPPSTATVVTLIDSELSANSALGGDASTAGGGVGGGIAAFGSEFNLERSLVLGNHAEGGTGASTKGNAGGGGLFLEWPFSSASPTHVMRNSIVAENTLNGSQGGGAGLRLLGTTADVSHVTFAANQILGNGLGLGILVGPRLTTAGHLTLSFSILADHTVPPSGRALHAQALPAAGSTVDLTNRNHFVGNSNDTNAALPNSGTYIGFPGSNIQDPSSADFFVNPAASDYHVNGNQPPTNSATASNEALDVDGAQRTGARDLGADEFGAVAFDLAIAKSGTGAGTVVSSPDGINCGIDCFEIYAANTVVDLDALAHGGSFFAGWQESTDCSDGSVLMNQDRACTAQFAMGTPSCTAEEDDLVLIDQTISTTIFEAACNSITAGPSYTVTLTGDAAFEAPRIILRSGFFVQGTFKASSRIP